MRWSRETLRLLNGSSSEQRDTAFCSLRKLPFCTAIWLMSITRLKICPTGCLEEAWDLAISAKSLIAAFPKKNMWWYDCITELYTHVSPWMLSEGKSPRIKLKGPNPKRGPRGLRGMARSHGPSLQYTKWAGILHKQRSKVRIEGYEKAASNELGQAKLTAALAARRRGTHEN